MSNQPILRISSPPKAEPGIVQQVSLRDRVRYVPGELVGAVLLQTNRIRQLLFCVAAGNDVPRHRATSDATITVVEGTGRFILDDDSPIALRPGAHLFIPKGKPHAVVADENLALLATFTESEAAIRFDGQGDGADAAVAATPAAVVTGVAASVRIGDAAQPS